MGSNLAFRLYIFLFSCPEIFCGFPNFEGELLAKGFLFSMDSTRRFFNTNFIIKNKLSFSSVIILQDIYFWIFGKKPPMSLKINNKKFFYISQTHFSTLNVGLLSQPAVNLIFSELKKAGIIEDSILLNRHMNYINFNWKVIRESIMDENNLPPLEYYDIMGMPEETLIKMLRNMHVRIDEEIEKEKRRKESGELDQDDALNQGYEVVVKNNRNYLVKKKGASENPIIKKEDEKMMLLDEEDMGMKPKIGKEADAIARLIIKKYNDYFSHRVPENGSAPTKTYTEICNKITDIYNGTFIKSRFYPLGDRCLNNKQFRIEGWRNKIKEVKGDWVKTKKLLLGALKNFVLMHDESRMPYKKDYLQTNLNLWLYDKVSNYEEPQSQFILCLFEPELTTKHNSELKADKIFETLSDDAKRAGNHLFELNQNMPSGLFWERVKGIIEWGKLALQNEPNIHYWFTSANELPELFARYCEEKKISVSVNTLDIKKAVEDNSPWTWFVKDMSLKHGLNSHLSELITEEDFKKCYKKSGKITFDDMETVPIF